MSQQARKLTPQQLQALQQKSLEILLYFKRFCEEHRLQFFFCGGCLIGALREQGFIPWDDDIDVFMPRNDYERLTELWPKYADTERYALCRSDRSINYRNLFINIRDNETTYIKPYQTDLDISHGLSLDVLPLDGCPSSSIKRKLQIFWALLYSIYNAETVPQNHGTAVKKLGAFLLKLVPSSDMRYRIWRFAERRMTQYPISRCPWVTELCSGPTYMRKEYPKNAFESAVLVEFEGYQMPAPKGYHEYLTLAFGDYMTPPPPEKQISHHDLVFLDMERGYQAYKGIHYCLEEKK